MRRHSHGCHRLHNHIAVRLFSFVVNHRPHARTGHQPTAFVMDLEYEEEQHKIEIRRGGYAFRLDKPIFVTVLEGRIKGKVRRPILTAIPKFNSVCKAYYLPDGSTVIPQPDGKLIPSTPPADCDPGLPPLAPIPLAEAPVEQTKLRSDTSRASTLVSAQPSVARMKRSTKLASRR